MLTQEIILMIHNLEDFNQTSSESCMTKYTPPSRAKRTDKINKSRQRSGTFHVIEKLSLKGEIWDTSNISLLQTFIVACCIVAPWDAAYCQLPCRALAECNYELLSPTGKYFHTRGGNYYIHGRLFTIIHSAQPNLLHEKLIVFLTLRRGDSGSFFFIGFLICKSLGFSVSSVISSSNAAGEW